ncbi:MAG: hypothetical protein NVSMB23_28490 [Myxococcales bacterium]
MHRSTAVSGACLLLCALGCGPKAPPPAAGTCAADAGAFAGTVQLTTDCVENPTAVAYPAGPACSFPHTPLFASKSLASIPDPGASVCVRPSRTSALATSTQTFCNRRVGSQIAFDVPKGTGSVTVLEQARSGVQDAPVSITDSASKACSAVPNSAAPTRIIDPANRVLLDSPYLGGDPVDAGVWYASLSASTGAMTFPDSAYLLDQVRADGGLPAGRWTLTVDDLANGCSSFSNCAGGSASGAYDVTIIAKPVAAAGTLDVGIYLVSAPGGLTAAAAATAAQSPTTELGRMIQTLQTLYKQAGICLGTVTFYDVPTWAQNRYSVSIDADRTDPCSALDQMFANLSQSGNTLNFFFVASITSSSQGGTMTVGIDGTIPGPATVGGTVHSGAAVSSADLNLPTGPSACGTAIDFTPRGTCGADRVAYIVAHEGGHALGLYHTVEALGDAFDPLSDTPQCSCASCRPSSASATCGSDPKTSYQMSVAACTAGGACLGGDNLMFWQLGAGSMGSLSSQQQQVMRGNPAVQ